MLAMKCVSQSYTPTPEILALLEKFQYMTNHCIRIGLRHDITNIKRMSGFAYHKLKKFDPVYSYYRNNAMSKACGILSNRKQSIKRGVRTKNPYMRKPCLVLSRGTSNFRIVDGVLVAPLVAGSHFSIPLNDYVKRFLSDAALKVRSFTLTASTLSIAVSKEVQEIECAKTVGVDRNLRNVTVGNHEMCTVYKCGKLVRMKENYRYIKATFRRNDRRILKRIAEKIGKRQTMRTKQMINRISKDIVENAKREKAVIVFEDLDIRKLYRKGNGQGTKYRGKMNGWPHYELLRQTEYKASWEGIPVIQINPECTSKLCPKCGKGLQSDTARRRDLWCGNCKRWQDRDVLAAMNISYKGLVRFANPQGDAGEAQSRAFERAMAESKSFNMDDTVIRIVDASKSRCLKGGT